MPSPRYYSPLRYPGGKAKLAEYVKAIIVSNGLENGCYVEPYAGGAAVALELLLLGNVSSICVNDLNASVYAFWSSVLNQTDALCERILNVPLSMKTWHQQKAIHDAPSMQEELDLGFAAFFLNRCNRSGIIGGGVIGGKNQAGKWKLDARFNREVLVHRIQKIASFKDRIFLTNLDTVEFLKTRKWRIPHRSLVYLDPPYFVKGKRLYDSFYSYEDHAAVAKAVMKLKGVNWLVSYDDVPAIRDLYQGVRNIRYALSYSAKDRYKGSEVMFFSDNLEIPPLPSKSSVQLLAS
ncbi:DNA adenine methylase [Geothrix fermentans]|uniref:DNA adenine methylase n=1 Tax=Geothrix fermentans TaxID=44676 RepID=UPI00040BFFAD|nr:DNA adenine methylase [Geothrix fermentans]